MTYEPPKQAVLDKATELIDEWLADDDCMNDALVSNTSLVRALFNARTSHDVTDAVFDLKLALHKYAAQQRDFMADAQDELIAETGYTVRTAVDDEKFVTHDTRY